jgi:hypothetical protein
MRTTIHAISNTKDNNMNKTITGIFGLALLVTTMPAFGSIEWEFNSGALSSGANVGDGTATITTGFRADGWLSSTAGLGEGAQGYWDLGQGGTILLEPENLTPGAYSVQVYQWVDTGFGYSGAMGYSISGGSGGGSGPLSHFETIPNTGPFGNWQGWSAVIDLLAGQKVTLTGAGGGSIVDKVLLTPVPEPATLIMGALLLAPFGVSIIRGMRKRRGIQGQGRKNSTMA